MGFIDTFQKMVWHNEEEEKSTPITAESLNRIEGAVDELCSEVVKLRDAPMTSGEGNGWSWRKYPDGGVELALKGYKISTSFTKQWGSLYYHGEWAVPAFPFALKEPPVVVATPYAANHHCVAVLFAGPHSTTKPANLYGVRPDQVSDASYAVDIIAIGRWK